MSVGLQGKRRIKLYFHVVGAEEAEQPTLEQNIRRRVMKWVRRTYASANLAPKIEGVEFLDAPPENMLAINAFKTDGQKQAGATTGQTDADEPSAIELTLDPVPEETNPIRVPLEAGMKPREIGARVASKINDEVAGFSAEVLPLPPDNHGFDPYCDLLITHESETVTIESASCTDTGIEDWVVEAVKPNLEALHGEDLIPVGSAPQRRILRSGRTGNWIDVYVVNKIQGLEGRAFQAGTTIGDNDFLLPAPIAKSILISRDVLDDSDDWPYLLCHEIGHVLLDGGHTGAEGCIMHGTGDKTAENAKTFQGEFKPNQGVNGRKRIFRGGLKVAFIDSTSILHDVLQYQNEADMSESMRTRGGPAVTEEW